MQPACCIGCLPHLLMEERRWPCSRTSFGNAQHDNVWPCVAPTTRVLESRFCDLAFLQLGGRRGERRVRVSTDGCYNLVHVGGDSPKLLPGWWRPVQLGVNLFQLQEHGKSTFSGRHDHPHPWQALHLGSVSYGHWSAEGHVCCESRLTGVAESEYGWVGGWKGTEVGMCDGWVGGSKNSVSLERTTSHCELNLCLLHGFSGSCDHPHPWQAEIQWHIAFGVGEPRPHHSNPTVTPQPPPNPCAVNGKILALMPPMWPTQMRA